MRNFASNFFPLLNTVEGSGNFVTSGVDEFCPPGFSVKGIGELGYPLNLLQINALIGVAKKAPFGKGTETIIDSNVRSAWEIDGSDLRFKNSVWKKFIIKKLKKIKKKLGIETHAVTANLYKLLIYEKGDFFLPHKDSEKEKGMFGTLVIGLPSKFSGGEIHVRFEGEEEIVDFSIAAENFKIPHVAFYADCEHEIKPLLSGHRVCLVYNLIQNSEGKKLGGPEFATQTENIANFFQSNLTTLPNKPIAVLLGHQYTPTNFSFSSLKNNDSPRAEVILKAAEKAGFFAKLGLVTSYLSGELEGTSGYDGYGYGRRRSYYEEEEEGTMGDVHESHIEIENWANDGIPDLGSISIDEIHIFSEFKLNEGDPIEQEQEGYTGNAGMTIDYWYHYGAVILWKKSEHANLIGSLTPEVLLTWMTYYLENFENKSLASAIFLKEILFKLNGYNFSESVSSEDFSPIAKTIIALNDPELISNSSKTLSSIFQNISLDSWTDLLINFDINLFTSIFQKVGNSKQLKKVEALLGLLLHLVSNSKKQISGFVKERIQDIPGYLKQTDFLIKKNEYNYFSSSEEDHLTKVQSILEKVILLSRSENDNSSWNQSTARGITKAMPRQFVNKMLFPVLIKKDLPLSNLKKSLTEATLQDLQKRINNKPSPPTNWTRPVPTNKEYYRRIWQILTPFLSSPTEQVFKYQAIQAKRKDMEYAIQSVTIDLKMETLKTRPAHTLVLTKTQAAYGRELAKWKWDVDLKESLNGMK